MDLNGMFKDKIAIVPVPKHCAVQVYRAVEVKYDALA
jgi:hypothetical protein